MKRNCSLEICCCLGLQMLLIPRAHAAPLDDPKPDESAPEIESIDALWAGFDPRKDPLELEVIRTDEEDEGRIQVEWLYFTGQTWDGTKTRVFAYRGSPKHGKGLPGVLHIHGGGQTANIDWPRYWARRGYVCVSFDFCGDTNLPNLGPEYRREHFTKWGKIQANMMQIGGGRQMEPSPRHNPWHHWVRMARRSLTLLESHPQVDPDRIGIFGISVGGTMTWMVAGLDSRVKAAVPIYGNGWESYQHPFDGPQNPPDRSTLLWRKLIAPEIHAPRISCPILFLSATNDGHGRMDLAARTLELTKSAVKRQLYSAGYDHHVEPGEGLSLELWMNTYLKGEGGAWPEAPRLKALDGKIPKIQVDVDRPAEVKRVDLYYCLNNRVPMSRYWQRVGGLERDGAAWIGATPYLEADDVIFAFATIGYASGRSVSSGLLELKASSFHSASPSLQRSLLISAMDSPDDWYFVSAYTDPNKGLSYFVPWVGGQSEKGFTLNPKLFSPEKMSFHIGTHKIGAPPWRGSGRRAIAIDVLSANLPSALQIKVVEENRQPGFKEFTATVDLQPSSEKWTALELAPEQFSDGKGGTLAGWDKVDFLALLGTASPASPPVFQRLRWILARP